MFSPFAYEIVLLRSSLQNNRYGILIFCIRAKSWSHSKTIEYYRILRSEFSTSLRLSIHFCFIRVNHFLNKYSQIAYKYMGLDIFCFITHVVIYSTSPFVSFSVLLDEVVLFLRESSCICCFGTQIDFIVCVHRFWKISFVQYLELLLFVKYVLMEFVDHISLKYCHSYLMTIA